MDWLRKRADNMAAGMLAAMFIAFLVQIGSRYIILRFFPQANIGWTVEVCVTLWLWLVFWGAAFCLDDRDHVKFDILYVAAGQRTRRILAVVAALAIVAALLASLPATWDYISFYKIKRSAVLKLRLDYVYSIYGVFAVAIVVRYGWRAIRILRGASPDDHAFGHEVLIEGEAQKQ